MNLPKLELLAIDSDGDGVYGYTAAQMQAYRDAALEEAAKVCEETDTVTYTFAGQLYDSAPETLSNAIDAIRALKGTT